MKQKELILELIVSIVKEQTRRDHETFTVDTPKRQIKSNPSTISAVNIKLRL